MIIEVDFSKPGVNRVFLKKDSVENNYCRHPAMVIDEHLRELSCEKCGKIVDAYDYVAQLANKENRLYTSINFMQREEQQLCKKIEELKKEHKNLKARVKTATKAVPQVTVKRLGAFTEIKEILK